MSERMHGLKFFSRTSGGGVNLASFHSPHCMCWSWILSFNRFRGDEARVWPLQSISRTNTGLQRSFRIPWLGILRWHRQFDPMPFRDLYRRMQDRLNDERYERPEPPIPPARLTVIDGGRSLH